MVSLSLLAKGEAQESSLSSWSPLHTGNGALCRLTILVCAALQQVQRQLSNIYILQTK